jgi:hypothetical protein
MAHRSATIEPATKETALRNPQNAASATIPAFPG